MANILLLDIENAPNLAHVWKIWDETIQLDRLLEESYILSYAAKWYGKELVLFDSLHFNSKRHMLKGIHALMDKADIIVHYNGNRHDIPHLNRSFLEENLAPPSPSKQIDLLTTVKNRFKFPSNKLAYVAKTLGLGEKVRNEEGHVLWRKCMADDATAWQQMKRYNIHDVVLLERLYTYLRPWIKNHPNLGVYQEDALVCPVCSGTSYVERKVAVTKDRVYKQYQCKTGTCRAWFRDTKSSGPKAGQKFSTG
jgi:hypothetical protein